jgi:nucleoid DNA-binding protein
MPETTISTGKAEIADRLYQHAKYLNLLVTRRQSQSLADDLLAFMQDTLIARGEVRLQGVGVVSVAENARVFRVTLPTAPGQVTVGRPKVVFKASDSLRNTLYNTRRGEVVAEVAAQVARLNGEG